jgi:hypothetical protein
MCFRAQIYFVRATALHQKSEFYTRCSVTILDKPLYLAADCNFGARPVQPCASCSYPRRATSCSTLPSPLPLEDPRNAEFSHDHEYEFPRMPFVGNSPFCIKKGVLEWYGYLSSLPTHTLEVVLPSDPTRSVLSALALAITRNADRILMQEPA